MAETALAADKISKAYGRGRGEVTVFKDLDFTLAAGEFAALLGPSGSGKSTLLNILGLMDRPDSGDVAVAGQRAQKLGEAARASLRNRRLGFVFQFDSLLPEFTLLENVTMPCRIALAHGRAPLTRDAVGTRARELLSRFGLGGVRDRFPSQASGGERQRAALCRALINSPSAILADEPTGNLDKENAELVFKDLRELSQSYGVAVLMATHNEEACRYANRILRMRNGALTEEKTA
ncbi:MAG: ABC transporter ATP-binding protein [Elusimicrobiota bacterium]